MIFQKENGDWTKYRKLPGPIKEVDFHYCQRNPERQYGPREIPYWALMENIYVKALETLESAYNEGVKYIIFTHGHSTSRRGKTTARSEIRQLMKSKQATPYIIRKECIQHESVFVAAIRRHVSINTRPN